MTDDRSRLNTEEGLRDDELPASPCLELKEMTERSQPATKPRTPHKKSFPIVGVGASAGGLEAFRQLLGALPLKTDMAFVLVQHLDRKHKSNLVDLLAKATKLPIQEIKNSVSLQPNQIYVIPPACALTVSGGKLKLQKREPTKLPTFLIDRFFVSLAKDQQRNAIGVVLSGTGTDGTKGLQAIKQTGGLTFAQDKTADFYGMPESAIQAATVDFVLSPNRIVKKLLAVTHSHIKEPTKQKQSLTTDSQMLNEILRLLREYTGTDLSQYKISTLKRRIDRRLTANNLKDLTSYISYLSDNPSETEILLQDMLIHVTSFFRDPLALQQLRRLVLPKLTAERSADKPLRLWVAGCATGEEAYSLAIIVSEYLDKHSLSLPVQIFATDLSASAIQLARQGHYSAASLAKVSAPRLKQFFSPSGDDYQVVQPIRDMCVFATHNLAADPPFSQLDLVSCCNVLIYLQPALQQKLLRTFHYALKPGGYMLLGTSETIGSSRSLFGYIGKEHKIYLRKEGVTPLLLEKKPAATISKSAPPAKQTEESPESDIAQVVNRLLLKRYVPASVVIDSDMEIIQFMGDTSPYLLPVAGKASFNLLAMARQGLGFELRNAISKNNKSGKAVKKEGIVVKGARADHTVALEVRSLPVLGDEHFSLVIFTDAADSNGNQPMTKKTQTGAKGDSTTELQHELESAREDMRRLTKEQEAANDELQVSNEEIQSSNEELQTLNEELETSGEELQSTNQELMTTNQELRSTNDQLNIARKYAEEITQTVREPLLVLGADLRVINANENFYKKFKVAKKITEGELIFKIGNGQWDIPELRLLLKNILPERSAFDDFEVTHDFPEIGQRAMILNARQVDHKQLILLAIEDITDQKLAAEALQISSERFRFMAESMPQKVYTANPEGGIEYFNPQMLAYCGLSLDKVTGWGWTQLVHPDCMKENIDLWQKSVETGKPFYFEHRLRRADGKYRWHLSRAHVRRDSTGRIVEWIGSDTDIEVLRRSRDLETRMTIMGEEREQLVAINKTKDEFIMLVSHQLRTPATIVKQYVGMVLEGLAGKVPKNQLGLLSTAYDGNERQLKIVDDLLRVALVDSGKIALSKSAIDIVAMITRIVSEQQHTFHDKQQVIAFTHIPKKLNTSVDILLMCTVIENLLDNASKYSQDGKTVAINLKQNGDQLLIEIIDHGVGISKQDQGKLFQKFSRIDNPLSVGAGGTGLGLYWAKGIVELHGGTISVISKIHRGSTFTITLPTPGLKAPVLAKS